MALTRINTKLVHGFVAAGKGIEEQLSGIRLFELIDSPARNIIKSSLNKNISLLNDEGAEKPLLLIKQYRKNQYKSFFYRSVLLRRGRKQFEVLEFCSINKIPVVELYGVFFIKKQDDYCFVSVFEGLQGSRNVAVLARDEPVQFVHFVAMGGLNRLIERIAIMHRNGVVHRDLKWSNLLVDADGGIRFVDTDHLVRVNRLGSKRAMMKDFARFVVGAYESQLAESDIKQLVSSYACAMSLEERAVEAAIAPRVRKLLLRKGMSSLFKG